MSLKAKIIARLKEKFPGVNLSNTRIDAIADKLDKKITDENLIDGKLDELNDIMPFADIAKQDDQVRTLTANQKPPKVDPPKPADPIADPAKTDADTPAWAKALIQQNQTMSQKLEALESGRTTADNLARLTAILEEKKIPKSYYSVAIAGRTFKDEDELNAFAANIATAYGEHNQVQTNTELKNQPAPVMGVVKDPKTEVSPMMKQYIDAKKPADTKKTA